MWQPLEKLDLREAAAVLGRAFHDNPGVRAILPDDAPAARTRIVEIGMRGFARATLLVGEASVIKQNGKIAAVSLAYPPGAYPPPIRAELIIASGVLGAGLRRGLRFARVDALMRKRHLRDPHFYLWVLGVEPELQGRGLGSALLDALDAKANAARVPCYLETDKPSSVRLYQKHGYVVQSEGQPSNMDFTLWFMQRPKLPGA
jgi:ribosomal protein S18 acetylase RimI-like enzyme